MYTVIERHFDSVASARKERMVPSEFSRNLSFLETIVDRKQLLDVPEYFALIMHQVGFSLSTVTLREVVFSKSEIIDAQKATSKLLAKVLDTLVAALRDPPFEDEIQLRNLRRLAIFFLDYFNELSQAEYSDNTARILKTAGVQIEEIQATAGGQYAKLDLAYANFMRAEQIRKGLEKALQERESLVASPVETFKEDDSGKGSTGDTLPSTPIQEEEILDEVWVDAEDDAPRVDMPVDAEDDVLRVDVPVDVGLKELFKAARLDSVVKMFPIPMLAAMLSFASDKYQAMILGEDALNAAFGELEDVQGLGAVGVTADNQIAQAADLSLRDKEYLELIEYYFRGIFLHLRETHNPEERKERVQLLAGKIAMLQGLLPRGDDGLIAAEIIDVAPTSSLLAVCFFAQCLLSVVDGIKSNELQVKLPEGAGWIPVEPRFVSKYLDCLEQSVFDNLPNKDKSAPKACLIETLRYGKGI